MSWYKVWMVIPGTDGDAENGPCEPQWWNDMVQAGDEHTAIAAANASARADWEASDGECPCGRDLGTECPVCMGAAAVTDEEYTAWKNEFDEMPAI